MGRSAKEDSPFQPDGSLLSIVGDLLFAGAILVMIYPCLRKTIGRLDGQFFRQFFYIVEVLVAVAVLCFVLMLLIGQQMRIAYCSFIRPYMGHTDEDKAYIGVVLKIVVCFLLLFNYVCASGLQRLMGLIGHRFRALEAAQERTTARNASEPPRMPSYVSFGDALTNNSNTNSQTPVTQTQSVMQSDILPFMSFSHLSTEPYLGPGASREGAHILCRDVGTMVRFPVAELQHNSQCTFHLCPAHFTRPSTAPPATVLFSSLPSPSSTTAAVGPGPGIGPGPTPPPPPPPLPTFPDSRTGRNVYPREAGVPDPLSGTAPRAGQWREGAQGYHADSSCHARTNAGVQSTGWGPPGYWDNVHHNSSSSSTVSKATSSCASSIPETRGGRAGPGPGPGPPGLDNDPLSSGYSSDTTGSSGSSGGSSSSPSNQSSFLSNVGLTSSTPRKNDGQGQGSRSAVNVEKGSPPKEAGGPNVCPIHSLQQTPGHLPTSGAQTAFQICPGSVWTQRGGMNPTTGKGSFCISHSSAVAINSPKPAGPAACSVPSNSQMTPTGGAVVPTHVHTSTFSGCLIPSTLMPTGIPFKEPEGFSTPTPTPGVSRTPGSGRSGRRRELPPMPKMTRSGKIYGYS